MLQRWQSRTVQRWQRERPWLFLADDRWTVLIDVARQELHDFQTMNFDGMSTTAESLRSISRSIAQLSDVIPEVSSRLARAPSELMVLVTCLGTQRPRRRNDRRHRSS
jgi:hypothetical protein